MFTAEIEQLLSKIEADNYSGAAELTVQAADALQAIGAQAGDDREIEGKILAFGVRLISGQPTMGSLFTLVNGALLGLAEQYTGKTSGEFIENYCSKFLDTLNKNEETLYRKAAGVLRDGDCILTHSASSTVRETILAASEAGKAVSVICTESRPQCEGVALARALAEHGITVRLIPDAAMEYYLTETDVVLLGADAVRTQGFYNKIGTSMLAAAAHAHGVDLYVLCTLHKFIPPDAELPPQPMQDPAEVLPNAPRGLTPLNIYFEETPLRHCSGLISECGILKPAKLRQKLHPLKTAPALLNILADKTNQSEAPL